MPKLLDQIIQVLVWGVILSVLLTPLLVAALFSFSQPPNATFEQVQNQLLNGVSADGFNDPFNNSGNPRNPVARALLEAAADRSEAKGAFSGLEVVVLRKPVSAVWWTSLVGSSVAVDLRLSGHQPRAIVVVADQALTLRLDAAPETTRAILALEGPQAIQLSGRRVAGLISGYRIQAFGARDVASVADSGLKDGPGPSLCKAIALWRDYYDLRADDVSLRLVTASSSLAWAAGQFSSDGETTAELAGSSLSAACG